MSDIASKPRLASGGSSDPTKEQDTQEPSGDTTPTIPQSQDYRVFPPAGTPELVLSVSDVSPPSFALDLGHSFSVYTENLLIQGDFRTSNGNLVISTHSLDVAPTPSGKKYQINCSGSDGGKINVSGGVGGMGGLGTKVRGRNGTRGKDGTSSVDFFTGDSASVRQTDIILAHPDQCRMLLEKAKGLYSLDDISSTVDCHTLLARLQRRLFFLRQLQRDDKLYQAYVSAEKEDGEAPEKKGGETAERKDEEMAGERDKKAGHNRLFLPPGPPPSNTNPNPEATSIVSLRQVLAEASGLVTQIDNGLDYYGHVGAYAPMLSYNTYKELTNSLLESAKQAEKAYDKFTAEDAKQEARRDALQAMQTQCKKGIQIAEDTIAILKAELKKTEDTVASLTIPLKAAKSKLHDQIEHEKDKINKSFNLFKMPFSNIVDALSMVIFCPKAPMAAAQTAGLLWKAGTNVPDDKGQLINKTYLVNQVTQIEARTDALDEGLKSRDDGSVDIADPGASKLITARDDMMKLLQQYTSFLGSNELEDVEKTFDNYISLVEQRNTAVLHYNACVNLWYTNQQHEAYYTHKRDSLSDTVIKTIDPNLPAIHIFVQKAYSDSVAAVMEALYRAQRSYRFAALTFDSPLSAALGGAPSGAIRHADLDRASKGILNAYFHALDAWGRAPQDFHGVTWPLSEDEWAALQTTQGAYVVIPPATAGQSEAQHPFAGKCNVRVTRARLFVTGAARTASGFLSARLMHSGAETVVDAANAQFQFYHNPITREFRYRIAAGEFEPDVDTTVDGDMSEGGESKDDSFALVGPFTTWSIDLASNGGLDLSEATGAYFKFYGKCYPFE
ncbi:86fc226c-4f23-4399-a286-19e6df500079 [Thermothielavioides terrestris]|uniref:86fc226c-4f23-4399-a286-19e6df500079 n=1 Tax=Thermothielavioides terrestris TaxID=2587410 RepID=A0A446BP02_9PEZI|nr:86fc226c-4f23-4399-a286-19e6df500079 [Thermothielavioides terrestris]